jgi:hypothetical protein
MRYPVEPGLMSPSGVGHPTLSSVTHIADG